MGFSFRSLTAAAPLAVTLLVSLPASGAAQQHTHPIDAAPTSAEFMPRFDWEMWAAYVDYPDQRFTWDTHWAGDFDLFSFPKGRATFLADYQALLGSEFRPFDPYQSNYLLEASGSLFAGNTEFAAVLSHDSRHLGDRPKRLGVAENSLGLRVMRRVSGGGNTFDIRGDFRKVIERAYVDYSWIGDVDLAARRQVSAHAAVYGRGYGELFLVDPAVAGRTRQLGGRVEAGVKVSGAAGAMEYFLGAEQMVDADPLDRQTRRWIFIGFRLLGH
jgi:hypothetical protein